MTKTLLQELDVRRTDFVHANREAPWIHLTRKLIAARMEARLK